MAAAAGTGVESLNRTAAVSDLSHGETVKKSRESILDQILVMRCQEGDSSAFEQLVRRWQRRLWRYALHLTGRNEAAWDVSQEAWIAILRGIRRLDDPATFTIWAYRIVRNKSADHWRRSDRRRQLIRQAAQRSAGDDDAGDDDRRDNVSRAMRRLSGEQQEMLALRYSHDLSIGQIARTLGVPSGTAKSRLYHARQELKRYLEGDRP